MASRGEACKLADPFGAERCGEQHVLGALEPHLDDVAMKRFVFTLAEQLGEIARSEAGDARHLVDAERLGKVVAYEGDGPAHTSLLTSPRRSLERELDVCDGRAIARREVPYRIRVGSPAQG